MIILSGFLVKFSLVIDDPTRGNSTLDLLLEREHVH